MSLSLAIGKSLRLDFDIFPRRCLFFFRERFCKIRSESTRFCSSFSFTTSESLFAIFIRSSSRCKCRAVIRWCFIGIFIGITELIFLGSDSTLFEQRRSVFRARTANVSQSSSSSPPLTFRVLSSLLSARFNLHRFQRTAREVTRIADSNLAIDDLTRSVRRISSLFRQTRYGKARGTPRRPALPSRSSNHRPARYHLSLQKQIVCTSIVGFRRYFGPEDRSIVALYRIVFLSSVFNRSYRGVNHFSFSHILARSALGATSAADAFSDAHTSAPNFFLGISSSLRNGGTNGTFDV